MFTEVDMALIRRIIADNPNMSRSALSREVCRKLAWYKPDGGLKEMRCRVVMIQMHKDGLIQLPAPRKTINFRKAIEHTQRTEPQSEIACRVDFLSDIRLELVSKATTSIWNEYIDRYHYLGYTRLPGSQLRYISYANNQIVACLGFGAAAWKTAPRDKFIGWNEEQRKNNLHLIVNNVRFLILPWINSKNLASKLLSMISNQLPVDWQNRYNYQPVLLETFVESQRFTGACYKAANWLVVGKTKGRGRNDFHKKAELPVKDILLFPLQKNFKKILCS